MWLTFSRKTVIITGASGGIGSETARLFAEQGANITVNYFSSKEKAEKTVGAIQRLGTEAFAFKADISCPIEVSSMIEETMKRFGRIDILVNNSSKHPPPVFNFDKPDWELWKRMAHVNMMGILVCSHYAAPYLKETNGNIINVVMDYEPGGLGYVLTKAAGTPVTRGLARKLAPIRVNAISPGAIDTWGMTKEEKKHYTEKSLLKKVGQPKDIARVILFLASDKASFITGETIHVDGGKQLLE
ncbi:MAG: SDR family oxidoreductase [Candidatus Heimdallarchaeota archaeon]|nr:SDR family oxidoreductase [Candidatus Heimdallarchaeota archaeon]